MVAYELRISGKVQGVWYRASAKRKAEEMGIKGFAKNCSDGTVQIVAEGQKETLEQFIRWCEDGPELANVSDVRAKKTELQNFKDFDIRR